MTSLTVHHAVTPVRSGQALVVTQELIALVTLRGTLSFVNAIKTIRHPVTGLFLRDTLGDVAHEHGSPANILEVQGGPDHTITVFIADTRVTTHIAVFHVPDIEPADPLSSRRGSGYPSYRLGYFLASLFFPIALKPGESGWNVYPRTLERAQDLVQPARERNRRRPVNDLMAILSDHKLTWVFFWQAPSINGWYS